MPESASNSRSLSSYFLVAANLVPLAGVLFLGWDFFVILYLYWLETIIIGLFNIVKMFVVDVVKSLIMAPIFAGVFAAASLIYLLALIIVFGLSQEAQTIREKQATNAPSSAMQETPGGGPAPAVPTPLESSSPAGPDPGARGAGSDFSSLEPIATSDEQGRLKAPDRVASKATPEGSSILVLLFSPLAVLFISHAFSFFVNFIGRKEYLKVSLTEQMVAPFQRLGLIHAVVLCGGACCVFLDSHALAVVVLILLKTVLDEMAHVKEHSILAVAPVQASSGRAYLRGDLG